MKKALNAFIMVFILTSLTACGNAENSSSETKSDITTKTENTSQLTESEDKTSESKSESETESTDVTSDNDIAVVYFSATGTTKEIAGLIADETGADIYEIIPKVPYSSDDLNYNDDNCRANKEQGDDSARPEIENDLSAVEEYEVVYLGYPIWWGTNPKIIQTFCESYDLSDADIYTFCTSGSSEIDASIKNLKNSYNLNIIDGKRLNDATSDDIHEWINELKIIKEE